MPTPMLNIIIGVEHADNNIDIQQFMISLLTAIAYIYPLTPLLHLGLFSIDISKDFIYLFIQR